MRCKRTFFVLPDVLQYLKIRRVAFAIIFSILLFAIPAFAQTPNKSALTSEATLSISNRIYDVFVQDLKGKGVGLLTVRTGENHPATIKAGHPHNLLFGGVKGRPGTSFMTVRSYTTATDYVQTLSGEVQSTFTVQSLDEFGTVIGSEIVTAGDMPVGERVKITYLLPGPPVTPDALEIIHEIVVIGKTLTDTYAHVHTTIKNKDDSSVSLGVRYLWDIQMGPDDGPTVQPLDPDGSALVKEVTFSYPQFDSYTVYDNDFNDSGLPLFNLSAAVNRPQASPNSPTPPTLLSYGAWPVAAETAFDYLVDPTVDIATVNAAHGEDRGGDSALMYYFGHALEEAMVLAPGESIRVIGFIDTPIITRSFRANAGIPDPFYFLIATPLSQTAVDGQTVDYTVKGEGLDSLKFLADNKVYLSVVGYLAGAVVDYAPFFIDYRQPTLTFSITVENTPPGEYNFKIVGHGVEEFLRQETPFLRLNVAPTVPVATLDPSPSEIDLSIGRILPPEETDILFTTDGGSLNQYNKREEGIAFHIDVTRAITEAGNLDSEGRILSPLNDPSNPDRLNELIRNGVVSATARLRIAAFDVDDDLSQDLIDRGVKPEVNRVYLNGVAVPLKSGIACRVGGGNNCLLGHDGFWIENTFEVPIGLIRFPEPWDLTDATTISTTCMQDAEGNFVPIPRENTVRIDIDQENVGQLWRVAVDWASLSFKAMSPTIFIHGLNDSGEKGNIIRHSFRRDWPLLFDNSISLPGTDSKQHRFDPAESISCSARRLAGVSLTGCRNENMVTPNFFPIPAIARRFGVHGVHLVAHSKGGMDAREFIARYARRGEILSLTTIGTPHKGSVLADMAVAAFTAARIKLTVGLLESITGLDPGLLNVIVKYLRLHGLNPYLDPSLFTEQFADRFPSGLDDGTRDLTVNAALQFNLQNLHQLPPSIQYSAISADADRNFDQRLTPDESHGFEDPDDAKLAYRFLWNIETVEIINQEYCYTAICIKTPLGNIGGFQTGPVGIAAPSPAFQLNDGAVTVDSARDSTTFRTLKNFQWDEALNHFTLLGDTENREALSPVGELLIRHLQRVETTRGDFR